MYLEDLVLLQVKEIIYSDVLNWSLHHLTEYLFTLLCPRTAAIPSIFLSSSILYALIRMLSGCQNVWCWGFVPMNFFALVSHVLYLPSFTDPASAQCSSLLTGIT